MNTVDQLEQTEQFDNQTVDSTDPDEESGVLVDSKLKIFDPMTTEVFFEGRA
ncbi:hypothetical protein UFOVP116_401 [uncultured Caudovirales phage]|uniref:Uncharacterized protein n=1 Tax=uncultured Caudovirales phage TaxID=2100421 RepID=A0A6J5L7F6_9CAUD|nr:hypothetical protein UFOVP116_401 [uncultured Caudovirales phage]